MASRLRISLHAGLLALALAAVFLVATYGLRQMLISTLNRNAMGDLANGVADRAEFAFDYVVIKLGELHAAGAIACDAGSMEELQRAVFISGSVKDITVRDGIESCSVAERGLSRAVISGADGGARARNGEITIKAVEIEGNPAAVLTWKFSKTLSATAIINTEALVFDVLPGRLRDAGDLTLRLSNGDRIAAYGTEEAGRAADLLLFEAPSERYPFTAEIRLPANVLLDHNAEFIPSRIVVMVIVALVMGYLVARGLVPSPGAASRIRRALARREIIPYFQPSYDLKNREIPGFEVLARWPQNNGAVMPPGLFIPAVEANGLSMALLASLVRDTADLMADLIRLAPRTTFAFNVAPDLLATNDFPASLEKLLTDNGFDPRNIVIEITERQEITNEAAAIHNIALLKRMGIRTAIDDAGTGHNGLASIQRLGASILKIDKLFVDAVDRDSRSAALVQLLVGVANDYGMTTIAEGVENAVQLAELARLGVDEAQGFYLCEPADAATAIAAFSRHRALLLRDQSRPGSRKSDVREKLARLKSA